jgi:hypothetical protein
MSDSIGLRVRSGVETEIIKDRYDNEIGRRYRVIVHMCETSPDDPEAVIEGTFAIHRGRWCETEEEATTMAAEFAANVRNQSVRAGGTVFDLPIREQ